MTDSVISLHGVTAILLWVTLVLVAWGTYTKSSVRFFEAAWGCIGLFVVGIFDGGRWPICLYLVAALLLFYWSLRLLYGEIRDGKHKRTVALAAWLAGDKKEKDK